MLLLDVMLPMKVIVFIDVINLLSKPFLEKKNSYQVQFSNLFYLIQVQANIVWMIDR